MPILRFIEDLIVSLIVVAGSLLLAIIITALILSPGKQKERPKQYKATDLKIVKTVEKPKSNIQDEPMELHLDLDVDRIKKLANDIVENSKKPKIDETLLRIITREAGCDQQMCNYIVQALYNACEKYHWQYSPLEMAYKYQYAGPLSWYSKEAEIAYRSIFIEGTRYTEIGDATVFYASNYCYAPWHERQIFTYEYNGVRFFKERR